MQYEIKILKQITMSSVIGDLNLVYVETLGLNDDGEPEAILTCWRAAWWVLITIIITSLSILV